MSESQGSPGAPPPGGPNHQEHIAAEGKQEFKSEHSSSNMCGVTLSASVEGNAIAELMGEKPGVKVTAYPAMIRVDGENKLEFDMEEIADALGEEEFTTYDFEVETSTHYGRMVRLDDRILLFANPEDAAEALGFDLKETE
jgi:propane monooxygenase coupling protein